MADLRKNWPLLVASGLALIGVTLFRAFLNWNNLNFTVINGNQSLSSYQDYPFRASNVLLLRENFEHSVGKWPIGIALLADEGKLSMTRGLSARLLGYTALPPG